MILIIDNYDSFTYNLYQAIANVYKHVRVIRNDKITIEAIKHMQPRGIILSPGPGRPEQAGICVDLIKAIITGDMIPTPLLGVCLGHQAIVVASGGNVIQSQEISHGKEDSIFHQQQHLYKNMTSPFQAGRYHSLIAERETLPEMLQIEAENAQQMIMGIRHSELPIFGVQFHPESILTPMGNQLIQNFLQQCEVGHDIKK